IEREGPGYTFEELEAWLAAATPRLRRRPKEGNGHAAAEDPWAAIAAAQGFKPPIDVDARLAEMQFRGHDETAIHPTQLAVTASMLNAGIPVAEIVTAVLEATRIAAGVEGANWDWGREERELRRMCGSWLTKHPELADKPRCDDSEPVVESESEPEAESETESETKSEPKTEAKPQKRKRKGKGKAAVAMVVADGIIELLRQQGYDLLL